MDDAGRVALRAATDRRGDSRARVSQVFAHPDYPSDGRGRPEAGNAGYGGVPVGHELHVPTAQDRRVLGRPEPDGPDIAAGRFRHRRANATRRHPDAHDQ